MTDPGVGGTGQDFDLNIAPIIDCFTVLIAYLLISASFVSIGVFDVGVSTVSEVASPSAPSDPKPSMSVEIGGGHSLEIRLSGAESASIRVEPRGGKRNFEGLMERIRQLRERWPSLDETSVTADPGVEYVEIIRTVEALKKEIPKVFVGE